MSGKVWTSVRRSYRLHNKDYAFREDSLCASNANFAPGLSGNKESSSSDSSERGPPSPFLEPNTVQGPFGREAMRENNFSNTVFMDDISPGDNEVFSAHSDRTPPARRPPSIPHLDTCLEQCLPVSQTQTFALPNDETDYSGLLSTVSEHYGQVYEFNT
ncbi:hypothetical protein MKX01_004023 [Papaver californicum]|nr:hypothetical protein MKX01_004023 [Papaver californicum]